MMISPEEHRHNTGACMGTNDRSNGGDVNFRFREPGGNHIPQFSGYLRTVAIADNNLPGNLRQPALFHAGNQSLQSFFLPSGLIWEVDAN